MPTKLLRLLLASAVASTIAALVACVDTPTKADTTSSTHVDLSYQQFVLSADGKRPFDLSALGPVAVECGANPKQVPQGPKAGGAGILVTLATSLIGTAVNAFVTELQKLVNAEIAKYSKEVVGKPTRIGFYAASLWRTGPQAEKYSCFVILVNKCAPSEVDPNKGVCADQTGPSARVLLVGEYRLTDEAVQVRPLFGQIRGFEATRNPAEPEASIAATLKFESTWWDGHEGHAEAPMTATVVSTKFKPTSGEPTSGPNADPGTDLVVLHKTPTGYDFADWGTLPLLVRPPQSPGSDGTTSITATVAETNSPPEALTLIQKALGSQSSNLSTALKSALQNLIPATPAPKSK